MLWDARGPGLPWVRHHRPNQQQHGETGACLSPVWKQLCAHAPPSASRSKAAKTQPPTITSVTFVPHSYLLLSSACADTCIKVWDLRMQGLPMSQLELPRGGGASKALPLPHCVDSFTCLRKETAAGVSHVAVSDAGAASARRCGAHGCGARSGQLRGQVASALLQERAPWSTHGAAGLGRQRPLAPFSASGGVPHAPSRTSRPGIAPGGTSPSARPVNLSLPGGSPHLPSPPPPLPAGDQLLVSCLNSMHYLYDLPRMHAGPRAVLRPRPPAYKNSFYVRSAFSPCGNYAICGSKEDAALIWNVSLASMPCLHRV